MTKDELTGISPLKEIMLAMPRIKKRDFYQILRKSL